VYRVFRPKLHLFRHPFHDPLTAQICKVKWQFIMLQWDRPPGSARVKGGGPNRRVGHSGVKWQTKLNRQQRTMRGHVSTPTTNTPRPLTPIPTTPAHWIKSDIQAGFDLVCNLENIIYTYLSYNYYNKKLDWKRFFY